MHEPSIVSMKRVRGLLRSCAQVLWGATSKLLLLCVLLAVLKMPSIWLFRQSGEALLQGAEDVKTDLLARRRYLIAEYRSGGLDPDSMPKVVGSFFQGEWAVGSCSMLAAALANLSYLYPETREESLEVIRGVIDLLLKERFRSFDTAAWGEDALASLEGPNAHIGYLGHLNLVLGIYGLLGGDEQFANLHQEISEALLRRLSENSFPYLETYPNEIYTADNMVVYASLRVYADLFQKNVSEVFQRFSDYTNAVLLDPRTGLIVFWVDASGAASGVSRGSGVGWNSFYLPMFDRELAEAQFQAARRSLIGEPLPGVRGLREFAEGVAGSGDIDSGPVVLGLSTSGTAFFIAGARWGGDATLLDDFLLLGEIAGTTVQWQGKRQYLFAPLVGDAILLAMKTATPWDRRFIDRMPTGRMPINRIPAEK